jgi:hypothetical protein
MLIPAILAVGEIDHSDGSYVQILISQLILILFLKIRYTRTNKVGQGLIFITILMTVCFDNIHCFC